MTYFACDTETGSLKPLGNVLELCFKVLDDDFNVVETFHSFCKPIKPELVQAGALKVNGIKLGQLTDEPADVQRKVLDVCKEHQLLRFTAYNSPFDYGQLHTWFRLLGNHWEFEKYVSKINHLDVLKVAKKHTFKSYKLENVARELGVHRPNAHRADVDVDMMIDVLKRLYERPIFQEDVDKNRKWIDSKYIIFTHDGEFLLKQEAMENKEAFEYIWNWVKVRGEL